MAEQSGTDGGQRDGREDAASNTDHPGAGLLVGSPAELPEWLRPLAERLSEVSAEDLTRFTPPETGGRQSAVLALFGEQDGRPDILVIERGDWLRSHPGQPAFPGGSVDPDDDSLVACALREAHEETGLDPAGVVPVHVLPKLWVPPQNFVVTPVIAWWREPTEVWANDPEEIAAVHRVPIDELTAPGARVRVRHPSGYVGDGFAVRDMLIWGFTGGLLARLLELGGWMAPGGEDGLEEVSL